MDEQKFEVLSTAFDYIPNLIDGINKGVQAYQTGNESAGSLLVSQIVEGLQWIMDAIRLTQDVQKEIIDYTEINDKLNEIIDGFENSDFILISDILEYEIKPILESWRDKVQTSIALH